MAFKMELSALSQKKEQVSIKKQGAADASTIQAR
jgi:hypothetical protein